MLRIMIWGKAGGDDHMTTDSDGRQGDDHMTTDSDGRWGMIT